MALRTFGIFSTINREFVRPTSKKYALSRDPSECRFRKKPTDQLMEDYLSGHGEFSALAELAFEERLNKKRKV